MTYVKLTIVFDVSSRFHAEELLKKCLNQITKKVLFSDLYFYQHSDYVLSIYAKKTNGGKEK